MIRGKSLRSGRGVAGRFRPGHAVLCPRAPRVQAAFAAPETAVAAPSAVADEDHAQPVLDGPLEEMEPIPPDVTAEAPVAADELRAEEAPEPANVLPTDQQDGRPPLEVVNPDDLPFAVGDVVTGRVIRSDSRGAKISILGASHGIVGFMPRQGGPFAIRNPLENPYAQEQGSSMPCMIRGTTRRFKVTSIPQEVLRFVKGPILNARPVDCDLLWRRLETVMEMHLSQRETVRVVVHGVANKGLLVTLFGVRGFLPVSHIPKPLNGEGRSWLNDADLLKYVRTEVEVSLMALDKDRYTFSCSMLNSVSDKTLRSLRIGTLVWGAVRRVETWGLFMSIDDTFESALLHITNVSWKRIDSMEAHFAMGDRVRAVIVGMDSGFKRISVSTRDIEGQEGDMLVDKESVYSNAEVNVQSFLEHVREWEAQEAESAAAKAS